MKKIKTLICLFFVLNFTNSYGQLINQCDSIKVYSGDFDKLFQRTFSEIKSDTAFAIRHCFTTNGCYETFGILCWKVNGEYKFKKIQRRKGKPKVISNLDKKVRLQLIKFYEDGIYRKTGEIEDEKKLFLNDGPFTTLLFKTQDSCWRFSFGYTNSKDVRVVWTKDLISLLN